MNAPDSRAPLAEHEFVLAAFDHHCRLRPHDDRLQLAGLEQAGGELGDRVGVGTAHGPEDE